MKIQKIFLLGCACLILICTGISASVSEGLLYVDGPCNLQFPQDHGPHPRYRTEWWYYTGNVSDKEGLKFGFQLTFFRSRISDEFMETLNSIGKVSSWRAQHLILAHAALTELSGKMHYQAEKMARQALDIAGALSEGDTVRVFIGNWSLDLMPHHHILKAESKDFALDVTLVPVKKPVLHGDRGYSRKGSQVESASCYYSFTRLKAHGNIRVGNENFAVDGYAWMDHEFSTNPLEKDLVGWDWFSIQLDNNTELMAYFLRKKDGSFSDASSATFVTESGDTFHLNSEDLNLTTMSTWKSGHSGGIYPSKWRLSIPKLNLNLEIDTAMADQEMRTPETTGVTYWEGSVTVKGLLEGQAVSGRGYTELTGYAEPLNVPM